MYGVCGKEEEERWPLKGAVLFIAALITSMMTPIACDHLRYRLYSQPNNCVYPCALFLVTVEDQSCRRPRLSPFAYHVDRRSVAIGLHHYDEDRLIPRDMEKKKGRTEMYYCWPAC
jgi:hypothetical protein